MVRFLRRGKGHLFVLLFATLIGSYGCVHGTQPAKDADQMESSQNEDLANDTANGDEQGLGKDDETADKTDDGTKPMDEPAPLPEPQPAAQAALPTETPTAMVQDNSKGYVAGKAGNPIENGLPESGSKMAYIVQKGDTLSKIAKRVFSNQGKWKELAFASSVKNPNLIYPGDVIYYQLDNSTLAFARKYETLKRDVTPVKEGETLSQVSKRLYGDKDQWKFLWRHNDNINDPNKLEAGSVVYYVSPVALISLSKIEPVKSSTTPELSTVKKTTRHEKKV